MRICIALLTAVAALAQQAAPAPADPKKARIEGIVVNAAGGGPVSRAQVRAEGLPSFENGAQVTPEQLTALTGDDGKFVIENITPGTFAITTQKNGFVQNTYGARSPGNPPVPFILAAGETLGGLRITLMPQGSVSGRVIDANGDPVQFVQVSLTPRTRPGSSLGQLVRGAQSASTNDQGEYRLAGVAAGHYYLQAAPRRDASIDGSKPVPVTTYFPSATSMQTAKPVDITMGQDLRAYEIRLVQGRVYSASGKILDAAGAPLANSILVYSPKNAGLAGLSINTEQIRPDGAFTIRNVAPGAYQVQLLPRTGNSSGLATVGEFTIVDKDVADLSFRITSGRTITGSVRLEKQGDAEGDLQALLPPLPTDPKQIAQAAQLAAQAELLRSVLGITISGSRLSIGLTGSTSSPLSGIILGGGSAAAILKGDGTFALENVNADTYTLNLGSIPNGLYVKSVRYGDSDVTHAPINVGSSGGSLDIVLSKNAANVTGKLLNEKGEGQLGLTVSLWTTSPDPSSGSNGVRMVNTDRKGVFTFADLPPGSYSIAAFEDVDFDLAMTRDFVSLMTAEATKLELKEGETATPQLKLIPIATTKAAEEKLP